MSRRTGAIGRRPGTGGGGRRRNGAVSRLGDACAPPRQPRRASKAPWPAGRAGGGACGRGRGRPRAHRRVGQALLIELLVAVQGGQLRPLGHVLWRLVQLAHLAGAKAVGFGAAAGRTSEVERRPLGAGWR